MVPTLLTNPNMKHRAPDPDPQETELKLAVPTTQPEELARLLGRNPLLARRKPQRLQLHNVYYDTPDQVLHHRRCALRVRRYGDPAHPQWVQTFKTTSQEDSALSQRGEWEVPLATSDLRLDALPVKPWAKIDPDGTLFERLRPCFETQFTRTVWTVRRRDGSTVEVALDIGEVVAGDKRAPLCELEFELIAGRPQALFEVATRIAATVSLVPASRSKAQRGFLLGAGTLEAPLLARPTMLPTNIALASAAKLVLSESFGQFCTNLLLLYSNDDPELIHQPRVGWRRFKSARRLLRKSIAVDLAPSLEALRPVLSFLGELRDIDVARGEILPPLEQSFVGGDAQRELAWTAMDHALSSNADQQRRAVRYALEAPQLGATLVALTQWLSGLGATSAQPDATSPAAVTRRKWARQQVGRIQTRLEKATATAQAAEPEQLHQVRILAKRMRYAIEALQSLLPGKKAGRWHRQASQQQKSIGWTRDIEQTCTVLQRLEADAGLIEFLRGVAAERTRSQPH
ncbi:MAG: CHAD domain-containing protein [Rhodoferax sp.]|nr:CHAD domain-containing protein [Rhodoferax sp.]